MKLLTEFRLPHIMILRRILCILVYFVLFLCNYFVCMYVHMYGGCHATPADYQTTTTERILHHICLILDPPFHQSASQPPETLYCVLESPPARWAHNDGRSNNATSHKNPCLVNATKRGFTMRRLLGQRTSADSGQETSLCATNHPLAASYRPSICQTAVHQAGAPISCLDASKDGCSAVLGGQHILKIVALDGLSVRELTDMRGLIQAQTKTRNHSAWDQLSIKDVKWATQSRPTILTACANGKIFQYDVTRVGTVSPGAGLSPIQIREDSRHINTLDVNPHRDSYLLSGSQDSLVRFFDIRAPIRSGMWTTYRSHRVFKCNADAIRQVKWSVTDGFYFACSTEQGSIIKWDTRKHNAPVLRVHVAHDKPCTSISWHPDGDHLISGGWDNKCCVWDMSKNDRRQKAKYIIYTPAPVAMVSWRPGLWSATAQGKRAAQVAVAYDDSSRGRFGIDSVHIWDLARPTVPFKEINHFDVSPAAILWRNHDLLWTGGKDCLFTQCDVAFAPKIVDRHSLSSLAFSPRGDAVMFLDERSHAPRPRRAVITPPDDHQISSSLGSSPTAPMLSISKSDSEDDVVGTFLGQRRTTRRQRRESTRSVNQLSTTPPACAPGMADPVLSLEEGIKAAGVFRNYQALSTGHLPGSANVKVYQYLASTYLETLESCLPAREDGKDLMGRILEILETYACAAEAVSQFRLAQTWRILAFAVNLLLTARARFHLEIRKTFLAKKVALQQKNNASTEPSSSGLAPDISVNGKETQERAASRKGTESPPLQIHTSFVCEEVDSTSNLPTPIARPVADEMYTHTECIPAKKIAPVPGSEALRLSQSFGYATNHTNHEDGSQHRLGSTPHSDESHESDVSQVPSTEGYDFYDTEALRKAIELAASRPGTDKRLPGFVEPKSPQRICRKFHGNNSTDSQGRILSISDNNMETTGVQSSADDQKPEPYGVDAGQPSSSQGMAGESSCPGELLKLSKLVLNHSSLDHSESTAPKDFPVTAQTTKDGMPPLVQDATTSYTSTKPSAQVLPQVPASLIGSGLQGDDELDETTVRETDYLPWDGDPQYPFSQSPSGSKNEYSPPLEPYNLISRAIAFETQKSAVNAAAIILLLKPLVPHDLINTYQATAILRQFHIALMAMRLFVEATLLRNLCVHGWTGIDNWGESYPTIFGLAQQGIKVSLMCKSCRKPREIKCAADSGDPGVWVCDRCRAVSGPCAVCGHREGAAGTLPPTPLAVAVAKALSSKAPAAPSNEPILSTWWYCPTCGHGGHSTCLQGWHGVGPEMSVKTKLLNSGAGSGFSEGCCPLDGCGHACLPGKWRMECNAARTEELGRQALERNKALGIITGEARTGTSTPIRSRSSLDGPPGLGFDGLRIRGDRHDVPYSKAVESMRGLSVRENINAVGGSHNEPVQLGGPVSGILSSSPGRVLDFGRDKRKSVKFFGDDGHL